MFGFSQEVSPSETLPPSADHVPEISGNQDILINAIEAIGNGDYEAASSLDGALGASLKKLAQQLQSEANESLQDNVSSSMQSSEEMAALAQLSADIGHVSQNSEMMAAAIEEMATSTNQVTSSSSDAAEEARAAETAVEKGRQEVTQAVSTMQRISDVVETMSGRLNVLEQAADHISGMTQSIEDISDQTRLLALNATIEAARPGRREKALPLLLPR